MLADVQLKARCFPESGFAALGAVQTVEYLTTNREFVTVQK
jgi:hypothetical protein